MQAGGYTPVFIDRYPLASTATNSEDCHGREKIPAELTIDAAGIKTCVFRRIHPPPASTLPENVALADVGWAKRPFADMWFNANHNHRGGAVRPTLSGRHDPFSPVCILTVHACWTIRRHVDGVNHFEGFIHIYSGLPNLLLATASKFGLLTADG